MIISRPDISSTELQEFDKPFLKLPIGAYLERLNVEPVPPQIAVINGINNPNYRFGVCALARRLGKTYIANIIAQLVTLVPGCHILVMSPNYTLSTISWDLQQNLINHFSLETVKNNAKDKVIELVNGSTVRIGSVNQVDSSVGRSYDFIIFDEAALADGEDAFNISLRPTLDKPNAKALFISTPRGMKNWFRKFYERGFSNEFPEWFSIQATWRDSPRVSQENIDEARKTMSEAEFRQEYEADFTMFEGRIWNLNADCVRECDIELHHMELFAGLDLGFRDPTAFVLIGYCWENDTYYVLDEYEQAEKTTDYHAERIKEFMARYEGLDYIYIDSANQQQKEDFAFTYDLPTINARKAVLEGIGHVAAIIANDRLIVSPRCVNLLRDMDQYQWDQNPNLTKEKPLHKNSHMPDALRYALYTHRVQGITF